MEHCSLELPFSPHDRTQLHLKGPHTVHLTGFLELDDEDELAEVDEPRGQNGARVQLVDDDDDDDDDDDFDDEGEEDEDDDEDEEGEEDDDDDGEEESDDEGEEEADDDESEEEEVLVQASPIAGKKRAALPTAPAAKKPKADMVAATSAKQIKEAASTTAALGSKSSISKAASAPKATSGTPSMTVPSPVTPTQPWTKQEDSKLQKAMAKYGGNVEGRWEKVAAEVGSRNAGQCKKRSKAKGTD